MVICPTVVCHFVHRCRHVQLDRFARHGGGEELVGNIFGAAAVGVGALQFSEVLQPVFSDTLSSPFTPELAPVTMEGLARISKASRATLFCSLSPLRGEKVFP